MKAKDKKLSNPISTSGAGYFFEAEVQAIFTVLMLTKARLPYFRHFPHPWRIAKIKLQTKREGYSADDFAVIFRGGKGGGERKLLVEVKSSVHCNRSNPPFGSAIMKAWRDFNNTEKFTKGKDAIALVTGALSAIDRPALRFLVNGAKHKDCKAAAYDRRLKNFPPSQTKEKYAAIQCLLKKANGGRKPREQAIHDFLNSFYILDVDLGDDMNGTISHSLLISLIAQFDSKRPQDIWESILVAMPSKSKFSGTIDKNMLGEEITKPFEREGVTKPSILDDLSPDLGGKLYVNKIKKWDSNDVAFLALALLLGAWKEENEKDQAIVVNLLQKGSDYYSCSRKAQEMLNNLRKKGEKKFSFPVEILENKGDLWRVKNRDKIWKLVAPYLIPSNIRNFERCAISVLSEVASVEKGQRYSRALRKGIADGLVILGGNPEMLRDSEEGKRTSQSVVQKILSNADESVWRGLCESELLPMLAEAAPQQFLSMVTNNLNKSPSPLGALLGQEEDGMYGYSYATEIAMAMECLVWDKERLVDVCMTLGKMASFDLVALADDDARWSNAPFNSLVRILLPQLQKPEESWQKRKDAMKSLVEEFPDVGLKVLFSLLPGARVPLSDIYKPKWRKVPEKPVLIKQYKKEVSFYSSMLIKRIGHDVNHLTTLIDNLAYLPEKAFNLLTKTLKSSVVVRLSDKERFPLWLELVKFNDKNRFHEEFELVVARVEEIAKLLAPKSPFYLHQKLLGMVNTDPLDKDGDRDERQARLCKKQEVAVRELLKKYGFKGVLQFSDENVPLSSVVGHALGFINDKGIEGNIFPDFLEDPNINRQELVMGFIVRKRKDEDAGWRWFDTIDKSKWTSAQLGCFLAHFRFNNKTWEQVSKWLSKNEGEYWSRAGTRTKIYPRAGEKNLPYGLAMLIKHGNVALSINLLHDMLYGDFSVDIDLYVQALLCLIDSDVKVGSGGSSILNEMIRHVHRSGDSANKDYVLKIERHFALHVNFYPKTHAKEMADKPEFFCKVVRWAHPSSRDEWKHEDPNGRLMATASQWLLKWKTIPGLSESGENMNVKSFMNWFNGVKKNCEGKSYWRNALSYIGSVLAHAPADSDLWINRDVAMILNKKGNEDYAIMRKGFSEGLRSLHSEVSIGHTGKTEERQAKKYKLKARQLRAARCPLLAKAVDSVADYYEELRKQIIDSAKRESEENKTEEDD